MGVFLFYVYVHVLCLNISEYVGMLHVQVFPQLYT